MVKNKQSKATKNSLHIASGMGTNFVANVLVGAGFGYILDYYLHRKWVFFLFLALGICAGIKTLYVDTQKLLKSDAKEE